jgi:signal peptidase I
MPRHRCEDGRLRRRMVAGGQKSLYNKPLLRLDLPLFQRPALHRRTTTTIISGALRRSAQGKPVLIRKGFFMDTTQGALLKADNTDSKLRKKHILREYLEAAAIAVLLALFIRTFVVQAFKIPSGSMEPTLQIGDHILVSKFIYGIKIPFTGKTLIPLSRPEREDVIVFIYPVDHTKDFIKRVIGVPGDRVEIIEGKIHINGKIYEDKYGHYTEGFGRGHNPGSGYSYGPVTVPENQYFVMGDNRDHSYDSRFWGFVSFDAVKGKAFIVYWSWPHWKRCFRLIR